MKIHPCHLHPPLLEEFARKIVSTAPYASYFRNKLLTKCDGQLSKSNFHTRTGVLCLYAI
ncbi:DUF6783 domain-containing protein [uncultured Robinsoniella sp.]|uniref:DUF6783 domain-containing protein n=1 Tax=uncultured Robinsoniella sp. TaxID=904190 RepID=UPI00374E3FA0